MPVRIQMSRQRPWRAEHPNAVRVDRATKWGNPICIDGKRVVLNGIELFVGSVRTPDSEVAAFAVRCFERQLFNHPNVIGYTPDEVREALVGRDLACWCRPDRPCHADVLLKLANGVPA